MNYKKIWAFDFECTSREPAISYMCSFCRLDKTQYKDVKTIIGNKTIESTIDFIFKQPSNSIFFAHNLKYDISFILAFLFKNHKDEFKIIEKIIMPLTKTIFRLSINFKGKTIVFRDSLALFSAPLSKVMKAYTDFEKTETPIFDYINEVTIGEYELKYSKIDALALAVALKKRLEIGRNALTTAGDALKVFKETLGKKYSSYFPLLNYEINEEIRKAYKGGFTFLNPIYVEKKLFNVDVIDINSMYPSIMKFCPLPYGEPFLIETGEVQTDDLFTLGIQNFRFKTACIKNGFIPFLTKSNTLFATNVYQEIFLEDEDIEAKTFSLTLEEFELFKKSYEYEELELLGGWLFKSKIGLFDKYIETFWAMKLDKDETIKNNGKLFLNSLYGKFAESYKKDKCDIYYDEKVSFEIVGEEEREVGYIPVGVFITSNARLRLIKTILSIGVDNFVYCDTDSVHYINSPDVSHLEFHDVDLGAWGYKCKYDEAYYIRAKRYIGSYEGKLDIACAGIKKNDISKIIKKVDDFKTGVEVPTIEFKQGVNGQFVRDKIVRI